MVKRANILGLGIKEQRLLKERIACVIVEGVSFFLSQRTLQIFWKNYDCSSSTTVKLLNILKVHVISSSKLSSLNEKCVNTLVQNCKYCATRKIHRVFLPFIEPTGSKGQKMEQSIKTRSQNLTHVTFWTTFILLTTSNLFTETNSIPRVILSAKCSMFNFHAWSVSVHFYRPLISNVPHKKMPKVVKLQVLGGQ